MREDKECSSKALCAIEEIENEGRLFRHENKSFEILWYRKLFLAQLQLTLILPPLEVIDYSIKSAGVNYS